MWGWGTGEKKPPSHPVTHRHDLYVPSLSLCWTPCPQPFVSILSVPGPTFLGLPTSCKQHCKILSSSPHRPGQGCALCTPYPGVLVSWSLGGILPTLRILTIHPRHHSVLSWCHECPEVLVSTMDTGLSYRVHLRVFSNSLPPVRLLPVAYDARVSVSALITYFCSLLTWHQVHSHPRAFAPATECFLPRSWIWLLPISSCLSW